MKIWFFGMTGIAVLFNGVYYPCFPKELGTQRVQGGLALDGMDLC